MNKGKMVPAYEINDALNEFLVNLVNLDAKSIPIAFVYEKLSEIKFELTAYDGFEEYAIKVKKTQVAHDRNKQIDEILK